MLTATLPRTSTHNICIVCLQPADDAQSLVRELAGYIHPGCSARRADYKFVTAVSVPDEDPEPDPTSPAPAAALTGPELCPDCTGCHDHEDICPACQELINEWESDRAPDWDVMYERYLAAKDYLLAA